MVALYTVLYVFTLFHSIVETVGTTDFNLVVLRKNYNTSELISSEGVCSNQGIPPLPVALENPQAVFFNDHLLVCGKLQFGDGTNCYKVDSSSSSWTPAPKLNIPRDNFILIKAKDEVFALGDVESEYSIQKYSDDTWDLLTTNLAKPVYGKCAVYLNKNNSLVVIGGGRNVNSLDLATLEWSSLPPIPGPHQDLYQGYGCATVQEGGQETIVVTGGWKIWEESNRPSRPCDMGGEYLSQVYSYNGATWSLTGQLMGPRAYHSMAVLDGRPVVLGGSRSGAGSQRCRQIEIGRLERMNEAGKWEELPAGLTKWSAPKYPAVAQVPAQAFPCLG